jgi:hypothetical protein
VSEVEYRRERKTAYDVLQPDLVEMVKGNARDVGGRRLRHGSGLGSVNGRQGGLGSSGDLGNHHTGESQREDEAKHIGGRWNEAATIVIKGCSSDSDGDDDVVDSEDSDMVMAVMMYVGDGEMGEEWERKSPRQRRVRRSCSGGHKPGTRI